jgi:hypothetical protein
LHSPDVIFRNDVVVVAILPHAPHFIDESVMRKEKGVGRAFKRADMTTKEIVRIGMRR